MEILSPGALPNIVTLDNMRHTRYSRNPSIARTLAEMGWVRELNEGVQRIYDEMQSFFLNEPLFSEPNEASVLLTLENSITSRVLRRQDRVESLVGQKAYETLNKYEIAALQYVYAHGKIQTKDLVSIIGKGPTLCSKTLKKLAKLGILEWYGTSPNDPSQFYSLPK